MHIWAASSDMLDSVTGRMLRSLGRNKAKDLVIEVMQEIRPDLAREPANQASLAGLNDTETTGSDW